MTYKALYRFYRPQVFQDVAGQRHIVTTMQNAILEKRMGHAYLFSGPRGTGKTTIAKIVAKGLNCLEENAPCGTCESCISIASGQHPDVIEIDAASNNGVDEVRDLIDKIKYAPIQGKYKVYIIDEVHMMTTGAFNALLKTLEEPPAHAIFILATTEPHKVIPTILSRCQRFDFQKVSMDDIVERLKYVLDQENKNYDIEAVRLIAKMADGGMRDSLSILEQCLAYNNHLEVNTIHQIYGLLSMEKKLTFIKRMISKNIKEVLSLLDEMLNGGIDIKRLTFDLIDVLKDIVIYKNTNDLSILFVLDKQDIDDIVPYVTSSEAFSMIDLFVEATLKYPIAVDATIYFELAILKICNNTTVENTKQIIIEDTKVENIQEKIVIEDKIGNQNISETVVEIESKEVYNTQPAVIAKDNTVDMQLEININDDATDIHSENVLNDEDESNEVINEDKEVLNEDIVNILVQANRETFQDIKEKWPILSKYRVNLNTAKFATKLYQANPVAACNNAFIITFEHQPEVNDVNRSNMYHELKNFVKEVFGNEFDFIAITNTKWQDIRNEFIVMKQNGTLPSPQPIHLHHIDEYVEKKKSYTTAQKDAIELFGADIVEIEE